MLRHPSLIVVWFLSIAAAASAGTITYEVNIDTSSISGTAGSLDLNFNPGPLRTQAASLQIVSFASNGTPTGNPTTAGDVAGALPAALTFNNGTGFNDYFQGFTFGSNMMFEVTLYGPELSSPDGVSTSGSTFAFSMFANAAGTVPLLATDTANGFAFIVNVNLDGTATVTNFAGSGATIQVNQVGQSTQSITFAALDSVGFSTAPITLVATASSGLTVSFASTTPSVCTISGNTLTLVGTGACSVTANQAGNASYAAAPSVIQSFIVNPASQTITFGTLNNQTLGTGPFSLSATASSGLAVTFVSNTTSICTVSGVNVTLVAVGTCSITASQAGNSTYAAAAPTTQTFAAGGGLQLLTLVPCRIMDTRNPDGPLGGPFVAGGTTRTIPIPSSACSVPANAVAYSLNFTVVPRTGALAYLSVWPTGQTQPLVSTLNWLDGSVLANAAIVPAGAAGAIDAFATSDTDLIVDINGYFVPPAANTLQFYALPPCRVLDTRNPNGAFGGPSIAGGGNRSLPILSSTCGAPANAAAYSLNVTVVPQGELGYLTAWPMGQTQPVVSTLNSLDGTILANAAIVPAGTGGAVSFFASNTTDVIVDINGYFAPPATGGLNFYTATPCRLVDTRNANAPLGGPVMSGGATRTFPLTQGSCGLPDTAQAYSLNMTVVPQASILGYLTTWRAGGAQPEVSTLNALKGQVVANAAIVAAGSGGSINVFVTDATDVIIDTNGYFGQ